MSWFDGLQAKLGGLAVYAFVRRVLGTLDYQVLYYDSTTDPALPQFAGPIVYVFWHEYIPGPLYLRPHCNLALLISRHRDAELLYQAARLMGYGAVRGSTQRGGDTALRELLRTSRRWNLVITPDGPRGPRRTLAAGCIYVASRLNLPLVAVGVGCHRPWRLPTWDRFAVPRPYSRCRLVFGPRLEIPADLDRDGVEHHRLRVEGLLDRLTFEAEAWAESGERRPGQLPMLCQPAPLRSRVAAA
jgi:lysophospholipid acyltransferase (LPLAT)-like uncharacterized protein